jgi:hypothetical protein
MSDNTPLRRERTGIVAKRTLKTERVSFRWPEVTVAYVRGLAERTGWSDARASAFLISLGNFALKAKSPGTEEMRGMVEDAATVHEAERKAAELVRAARSKVRKARTSRPPTKREREATAKAADILAG